MARIKTGSRVSTEAWRFDRKSVALEERWSYLQFGKSCVDARVIGTVMEKSGNRWLIKWDLDEETVSWEMEYIFKEDDDTPLQGIPN